MFSAQSLLLCARPWSAECEPDPQCGVKWGWGCLSSLGSFLTTSCHNYNFPKKLPPSRVTCGVINSVLAFASSGPNKKPFSLKEKQPGDGEAGPGTEDPPFQHSPLGKPGVRTATGGLLSKRCGWSFQMPLF